MGIQANKLCITCFKLSITSALGPLLAHCPDIPRSCLTTRAYFALTGYLHPAEAVHDLVSARDR